MQKNNNKLSGELDQFTIFGQLRFILGNTYEIKPTSDKKSVMVSGVFGIVGTEDIIDTTIEMEKVRLKKHLNK